MQTLKVNKGILGRLARTRLSGMIGEELVQQIELESKGQPFEVKVTETDEEQIFKIIRSDSSWVGEVL